MKLHEKANSFSVSVLQTENAYENCLSVLTMDIFDEFNKSKECGMVRKDIHDLSKVAAEKIMYRIVNGQFSKAKELNSLTI